MLDLSLQLVINLQTNIAESDTKHYIKLFDDT